MYRLAYITRFSLPAGQRFPVQYHHAIPYKKDTLGPTRRVPCHPHASWFTKGMASLACTGSYHFTFHRRPLLPRGFHPCWIHLI